MTLSVSVPAVNLREVADEACAISARVAKKADKENTVLILPTSDPLIKGALWNNAGVVNISAG